MKILKDETMRRAGIAAFALALIVALVSMSGGLGNSIDDRLRNQRYAALDKKPSGTIGMIAIDDLSLREIGSFPWGRSKHAELINSLKGSGIERLAFDIAFMTPAADPEEDRKLADAIKNADFPVALAVPTVDDGTVDSNKMTGNYPIQTLLNAGAEPVSIWFEMNEKGAVEEIPQGNVLGGKLEPSIAGWLSNEKPAKDSAKIDWSVKDYDIPSYSYSDIIRNGATPEMKGMSLIVGADSSMLGDAYAIPTGEIVSGARIHAVGAESLLRQRPLAIPELVLVLLALSFSAIVMFQFNAGTHYATFLGVLAIAPIAQWEIERQGIAYLPVGSILLIMATLLAASLLIQLLRFFYGKITQNEGTGLPNLMAMKGAKRDPGVALAITINNHVDIVSELGPDGRDKIMTKVAQRLEMGSNGRTIYQANDSTFVWIGNNDLEYEITQIQSLLALLRSGIGFGKGNIDIHASAGLEQDSSIPIEQAVTNAVIAANRANDRGISWEIYEKDDTNEHWKISVVSEISNAIEQEDLWVAYQPKVDNQTGQIIGAEALVRWQHPTRGDVRPDAFIPLLERANRTEDLTKFMLNRAMQDFSQMDGCTVAVNVSPLMIGSGRLLSMIEEGLAKHRFTPKCLTIEVTESERFTESKSIRELEEIKKLGVRISIDDYGMGNSTVNYLKILPADELKIDRSFISNMLSSHSDRIVVGSTIRLAHEMGLQVVAEGVESAEIQNCLLEMECDFIQGYHTGKPISFEDYRDLSREVNKRKSSSH